MTQQRSLRPRPGYNPGDRVPDGTMACLWGFGGAKDGKAARTAESFEREIASLKERIDILEEGRRQFRHTLTPRLLFPIEWELNRAETSLLTALYTSTNGFRSTDMLSVAINLWGKARLADPTITLRVAMSSMRRKLRDHGIRIITRCCEGYMLTEASKVLIKVAVARALNV